jgi:hypothetical protein
MNPCTIYIYIFLTLAFFFVGADTMKLNKSRLRQLALSGEVAAAPVSLKRKKVDEGSSKRAEEVPSRPSVQATVPPVDTVLPIIMLDVDLAPPSDPSVATINQSPHVAMDRAKSAISSRDMDEYAIAHTEDFSYLMVHSLMQVWSLSLLPFMVFPCVCVFDFRVFVGPD